MPTYKILIVDDEAFVRELLEEFLAKQDFEIFLADCGEAGIKIAGENDIDVALVDLKMPGIDGLETLKRLRNIRPNIPIIILTGYPTIETSIKALRLGASDYIIKPFKLNELKAVVEKALKERELKMEINLLRDKIKSIESKLKKYELETEVSYNPTIDTEKDPEDKNNQE